MIYERYRHRFEVNSNYVEKFQEAGLKFSAVDATKKRMEILELDGHKFYAGC